MKYNFLMLTLIASLLTGCNGIQNATPSNPPYHVAQSLKTKAYDITWRKVARSTLHDPEYKKLDLDTPEKKIWFKQLIYKLWDREITKREFIEEGIRKYPDHRYEFEFIAEGLNL